MKNLKLYYISDEYVDYLRQFDSKVAYKTLLENQLSFLNNNKRKLYEKIAWFIFLYQKNRLNQRILNRCCNFKLL